MSRFIVVDVNILAIILFMLIFFDVNNKTEKNMLQNTAFKLLVLSTAFIAVFDACAWLVNGQTEVSNIFLNHFFNYGLYFFNPLPSYLWVFYIRLHCNLNRKNNTKILLALILLHTVYLGLLFSNLFTGAVFSVDANGYYHRGPYYFFTLLITYIAMLYAYIVIISNRKKIDKKTITALFMFPIPPAATGILQSIFFGTLLVSPGYAISILVIYIYIQNKRIFTDYLTGVFNRREADGYIKSKINGIGSRNTFSAIILDIDKFKEINDTFGHKTGDEALEVTAKIIKGTLRSNDFIARYGGDEFLIVLDITDRNILESTVNRIKTAVENFNASRNKAYQLSMSMGYDVYNPASGMNEDQFIKHIDSLMYQDKKEKKLF